MTWISIIFSLLILSGCTGTGSFDGSSTAYKYQISGVAPLSVGPITALSTNFVLKWNEDTSGNITGIYTNQSTGESISITGTSTGSGRTINGTLSSVVSGASSIRFIIAQTGALSGTVSATFKTFDSSGAELSSQSVSVEATTEGGDEEEDDDDGGTGSLNSYVGVYAGTMTEVSNTSIGLAVGNGKYCDFSFSGNDMKFEFSNYLLLGYSTTYSSGDGLYKDITGADPAALSFTLDGGYPSATLLDKGSNSSGVKILSADNSAGKRLTLEFTGAFSGTTTKTLTGTLIAKLNTTAVCEFTVSMTKQ